MEWGQKMSSVTFFKFVFFPVYISFLHGYFILQNLSVQELVKPMTLAALLLCIVACVILTAHRTFYILQKPARVFCSVSKQEFTSKCFLTLVVEKVC